MEGMDHPVLLAQDYHFALLPRMIKKARPDARVAIFWHIPWPNPEAFGICPWQRELVDGLLGADLIGFHIQSHCTNFLQTVDRALESRIDWEHFTVNREEHRTVVKPFPISVEFPENPAPGEATESIYMERVALLQELGVEAVFLGVGVDRVDYTKGILERFLAIERLLEKHPAYREKFTFLQIGAPSRTHIKRYHDLLVEVESEAERINWRFQTGKWKPIVFMKRQHSHHEIQRFYRIADLCLVTSLHDGMNLVAKEFVAARQDEQGVLDPEPFHRRCPRIAGRAAGEPVRHRADGRSDPFRAGDGHRGTKNQDAAHAQGREGTQHLSLGEHLDCENCAKCGWTSRQTGWSRRRGARRVGNQRRLTRCLSINRWMTSVTARPVAAMVTTSARCWSAGMALATATEQPQELNNS